jgi:hypothetical protein
MAAKSFCRKTVDVKFLEQIMMDGFGIKKTDIRKIRYKRPPREVLIKHLGIGYSGRRKAWMGCSDYLNAKSSVAPLTFSATGDGKGLTQRSSTFFLIASYLQLPNRCLLCQEKGTARIAVKRYAKRLG